MGILLPEHQVANDHAVVRVDGPSCNNRLRAQIRTGPNLVDAEQRKTVGAGVSPATSGLSEGVEQTFPKRHECSIIRRCIEVAPDNQRSRRGNAPDIDHHAFDLAAVFDSIIAMIPPESRAPEVETKDGRVQPDAEHVRLESAEQLDACMDKMCCGVHVTRL